ncbi:MAG TPA: CDP-alcohol phosphatidyltransferase family protein [Stellaceae bacterium]|nr:CDP-alcohol phosphatidyltransferase family protein [Stellaceae bacterium]
MNLPNLITIGRLLSVPLAIWLVLSGAYTASFFLFLAAGLSDAIDGFIAKHFDQCSSLGAILDPLADKCLLVGMFITLGLAGHLPDWLVILAVFRDLLIIGGSLLMLSLSLPIRWKPLAISKLNTVVQIVLVGWTLARLGLGFGDHGIGWVLVYVTAATTVISGGAYLVRWARALAGAELNP